MPTGNIREKEIQKTEEEAARNKGPKDFFWFFHLVCFWFFGGFCRFFLVHFWDFFVRDFQRSQFSRQRFPASTQIFCQGAAKRGCEIAPSPPSWTAPRWRRTGQTGGDPLGARLWRNPVFLPWRTRRRREGRRTCWCPPGGHVEFYRGREFFFFPGGQWCTVDSCAIA